ncbi:hypothetical protein [Flavobacterium poyangense]|uniref:hypothetical protein n=1 Tax=Flavobacterium poyangense TaxID=2204302 RepID=UPI00142357D3|nr:hypothetical protein [Flavobacterium sp. JXAS1]
MILVIPGVVQLIVINLVQLIFDERLLYYIGFVFFWMLYLPYFYWLNVSVTFMYSQSNKYFRSKLANFRISLLINLIVVLNFVFLVAYVLSQSNGGKPDIDFIGFLISIQFIGIVSFVYNSCFICKLMATIELNRKVSFADFSNNFVAFSFPPLAISIIQNKIKKMQVLESEL